ncbi:hypothetical protein BDF20DRAFT_806691, partial [Mycotypha africana]|uniref:uncharacterized protein n=1 Tax=Mycotypha africana TaxID=64632 RepID=UPI002300F1BE
DQPKEMHLLFDQRDYIKGITFILHDGSREDFLDFGGSPQYIAPELSVQTKFNPEKADIWALGISLYRMLNGRYPFFDSEGDYFISHKELFKKMLKSEFDIP